MKKGIAWLKKPEGILAIALVLILLGSFLAGMFNTSMYNVKVSEIEFTTERGTLNGLLYMPKGAGDSDPRPAIVMTHGYLNTKEMQDAPAIEMSRRGYVVLALDMYDHGDSRWAADIPVGTQFGTFWIYSQYDAANYLYQQPYTLKDEQGNGYIAVSGHSMGGFSSMTAMYQDEMQSLESGYRMIYAGIPTGADFLYTNALVAPMDQMLAALGSRTVGIVGAHYDEFFFNKSDEEKTDAEKAVNGTVVYKDYPTTAAGKTFLGLDPTGPDGESNHYYTVASGDLIVDEAVVRESQDGQHVVFTPRETHPWNHFSKRTTGDLISFYTHVFSDVAPASMTNVSLSRNNQIWQWKEFFNLISLIGFFLLFVPGIQLLLRLPFFKKSITTEVAPVGPATDGKQKLVYWLSIAAGTLIPAIFFKTLMDKTAGLQTLAIIAAVIAVAGIVLAVWARTGSAKKKPEQATAYFAGGIAIAIVSALLFVLLQFGKSIVPLSGFFNEPTVNQIAYWAMFSGLLTALILVAVYYFCKKPHGTTFESYGLRPNAMAIVASLCTAVVAVVIAYAVLFITQAIFGVDYRIWTLAVRTFQPEHVWTALRYMPLFLVYYLANVVAINANTRVKKGGTWIAILMNIGGLVLWIALQYGKLFITGVAMLPNQSLNGILLFALIPCLAVAAVYARKLAQKTNNVWLAAFLNTILFTMISCANTAMFWNMI